LLIAGERLWIDLTGALRNGVGRRLVVAALGQVEPGIREVVLPMLDDPRLAVRSKGLKLDALRRLAPAFLTLFPRFVRTLAIPDKSRAEAQVGVEAALAEFEACAATTRTLADRLVLLDEITASVRYFMFKLLLPRFAPGMAALNQLYRVSDELPGGRELALEITRGLPHNVTTEMDLALWQTAQRIQADPDALQAFRDNASEDLAADYLAGSLPSLAQDAIGEFMARYGVRGLAEIDLGRPRWRENPTPVLEAVKSYVAITDPARAPDAVFARAAVSAEAAIERLSAELRRTPHGRIKAARARWAARRVRSLAGLRETPKFTIIRALGLLRAALLESGKDLVRAGFLLRPEDIFFLRLTELQRLAGLDLEAGAPTLKAETQARVDERLRSDERETRRRQAPRVLLSDGRAFYEGMGPHATDEGTTAAHELTGSPVSPGVVEGRVNVVLNPAAAKMKPGDILVCPGTDPSWTPLFLVAGALLMEVGGLMTHGSVVAREYGIPAVVGVHAVTTRLRTGQRVRVDGTRGVVSILDDNVEGFSEQVASHP
jgi:pyruvate,water dikinase